ncbi:phosphate ABC transporter substrate-binding protein PstS [Labrys wisconsinensis]|uniref:Phosphate-binding protein PstS n=1 Tax=Labrys wisconsinensis TaxID=425677 RepID=A0ABU0JE24_9HYPH|nr:phosphate ABC transporter substrate-binding protein PstS [Labrys wisconsinensis]MDQ0472521.1 phosphate transport system substrate-binding protein [Labrys wisconsinensis]
MKLSIIAAAAALSLAGTLSSFAADITGAGATFPAPAYTAWAAEYKAKTGNGLNYQAIGSGGGQTQIANRTVDFGASDAPLAADKLVAGKLLQFPTVIGAVVPIVNLDGIAANQLKLSGEVLGDIYAGKITKWNDEKIAALNKGEKLPDTDIAVVYRSDGSGTTYVFTTYLSSVNAGWKDAVGAATSVQWPVGAGAKGNDGVAGTVKNTKGAIGYVEFVYAAKNSMTTVELENKAGKFVKPNVEAFKAAAAKADWAGAKDFAASMINVEGDKSWPIVSATFILLPKDPKTPAQAAEVIKFFDWAYKDGGKIAEDLHYITLPKEVVGRIREAWKTEVKDADGKAVYN